MLDYWFGKIGKYISKFKNFGAKIILLFKNIKNKYPKKVNNKFRITNCTLVT